MKKSKTLGKPTGGPTMDCSHCHRHWPYVDHAEWDAHEGLCLGRISCTQLFEGGGRMITRLGGPVIRRPDNQPAGS